MRTERISGARRMDDGSRHDDRHIILIKDPLLQAEHRKPHTAESQSNWKRPSVTPSQLRWQGVHSTSSYGTEKQQHGGAATTALGRRLRITTRWYVVGKPTLHSLLCTCGEPRSLTYVRCRRCVVDRRVARWSLSIEEASSAGKVYTRFPFKHRSRSFKSFLIHSM